ncbi:Glycolipid transfer protein domain [Dillenia turbinata]|uniref:Glycolipid transfer protein domain n=1 Tax=Dillenia turbinata TaxID=194707 RepID=A0AAN8ZHT9_9MAGN
MKRRRESEMRSVIRSAIEEISLAAKIKSQDDDDHVALNIPTKPLLSACHLIIQLLDKIGPTMAVLRRDLHQNIQRIEKLYETDPTVYSTLVEILKKEVNEGSARKGNSCSKAILWLTRSMDFTVALLQILVKDPEKNMEQAVEESYNITLKPWHGWISAAAYKVALKLVPDNEEFINLLMAKDESYETLKEEIQTLTSLLVPYLEGIHANLRSYGLDRLKST